MADASLIHALVLGIVEGLTEFLPISSTGHLILTGDLIGFDGPKAKVFEIVIQTGAILAIVWEYRRRFVHALGGFRSDPAARRFVFNLAIAFMPAAVLGLAFEHRPTGYGELGVAVLVGQLIFPDCRDLRILRVDGNRGPPASFSTYLAMTSTSRLTTSPGCLKPNVVRARVSGIRLTVNDSGPTSTTVNEMPSTVMEPLATR